MTNNVKRKKEWEHLKLKKYMKNDKVKNKDKREFKRTKRARQLLEAGGSGTQMHFEYCAFIEF